MLGIELKKKKKRLFFKYLLLTFSRLSVFLLSFQIRYLLDNPDVVRGKSVLDLGSGCGATSIAAKMSGASRILANDIDPSKDFIFKNT